VFEAAEADGYFARPPPKSTDGLAMVAIFEAALKAAGREVSLEDQLATACALTASEIARAVSVFGDDFKGEFIVGGGGVRNAAPERRHHGPPAAVVPRLPRPHDGRVGAAG
jgi:1,6-anhydro-N-acetylmuramate kinase